MGKEKKKPPAPYRDERPYFRGTTQNSHNAHFPPLTELSGRPYCQFRPQLTREGRRSPADGFSNPILSAAGIRSLTTCSSLFHIPQYFSIVFRYLQDGILWSII